MSSASVPAASPASTPVVPTHPLLILCGSQTGTALEFARKLCRDAERRGFVPRLFGMDSYDRLELVNEKLVIFVAATTGDGDPPDNMKAFWRFLLRKGLPPTVLSTMNFACFGLGDSTYEHYNAVARKLRNRLVQLGAQEIVERGLGDDESPNGVEGDFDAWRDKLWTTLLEKYPLPEGSIVDDSARLPQVLYSVTFGGSEPEKHRSNDQPNQTKTSQPSSTFFEPPMGSYQTGAPILGVVKQNIRLTNSEWEQDVRHIEMSFETDCSDTQEQVFCYQAGDIFDVYPQNVSSLPDLDLDKFAVRLGLRPETVFTLTPSHPRIPSPCSVSDLFTYYLDVYGTPKRSVFEHLSFFASDVEEQEKLLELSNSEGNDLYHSYCKRERRTFVEVLADFPSCLPPLEHVIHMLPLVQPRSFSIASSPSYHGQTTIHICAAIVRYLTPWKRIKHGICSGYLETLKPGDIVHGYTKRGVLRLPDDASTPLVLIGPGTGVAPMRSLSFERLAQFNAKQEGDSTGSVCLYFGCRKSAMDFLYEDDWKKIESEMGSLFHLRTAFSRDQAQKIYVHVRLAQDGASLCDLLVASQAVCFISGSAKRMPSDAKETLVQAFVKHLDGCERNDAVKLVKMLEHSGKLVVEAWS